MMWRSHVCLAGAAYAATVHAHGQPVEAAGMAIAMVGGLLPDIDTPSSQIGRRIAPLSKIIGGLIGHRGLTHSLVAVLCCFGALLSGDDAPRWLTPLTVGYLSHLFADALTERGIPLLWPFGVTVRTPVAFKSGGTPEQAFAIAVSAITLLWAHGLIELPGFAASLSKLTTGLPGLT